MPCVTADDPMASRLRLSRRGSRWLGTRQSFTPVPRTIWLLPRWPSGPPPVRLRLLRRESMPTSSTASTSAHSASRRLALSGAGAGRVVGGPRGSWGHPSQRALEHLPASGRGRAGWERASGRGSALGPGLPRSPGLA